LLCLLQFIQAFLESKEVGTCVCDGSNNFAERELASERAELRASCSAAAQPPISRPNTESSGIENTFLLYGFEYVVGFIDQIDDFCGCAAVGQAARDERPIAI